MRYWWVNQKQTYRQEIGGGYLWSPKRRADQARNRFYDNMKEVAPGDLVFSYWGGAIRAYGTLRSFGYDAPKPDEFGAAGRNWSQIGYRADVDYVRLTRPVAPRDAPLSSAAARRTAGFFAPVSGSSVIITQRRSGSVMASCTAPSRRTGRRAGASRGTSYRPCRLLSYFGCWVMRRYGFGAFHPWGNCFLASSSLTEPAMITSCPCFQLTGVATLCFAVSCMESRTRSTSSKLRPVVIGYMSMILIFLSGPMMNTARTVALSAGVRVFASPETEAGSMSYSFATLKSASPIIG